MKQKIVAYLKDESGQTSTEYILLVAVAAAIVVKFKGVIMNKLGLGEQGGGLMDTIFQKVDGEVGSM